jgi:hypothetical protein
MRNMVNGFPGQTTYGSVVLTPPLVNISDDASVATTFEFENPIYLAQGTEYCIVLITPSLDYEVWLSEMGLKDLSGEKITKQPYAGVLFKSQNGNTWTTAELQDFKFKLYRASFKINETPTFSFINDNSDNLQFSKLRRDPIELNVNNGRIKVHHYNHGMHDNSSYVELKGVSSETYTSLADDWSGAPGTTITVSGNRDAFVNVGNINGVAPSASNPAYLKIGDIVYTYDPTTGVSVETNNQYTILTIDKVSGDIPSDGFKSADSWSAELYLIDGVPLTLINTVHSELEWITLDSYQINLSSITRNSLGNVTAGGDNVYASKNVLYTQIHPQVTYLEFPGTTVTSSYSGTSGTSLDTSNYSNPTSTETPSQKSYIKDSSFYPISLNRANEFSAPKLIASSINEERQMLNSKSSELRIQFSSTRENISPVINLERVSAITTNNRIANFDGAVEHEYFLNSTGQYTDIGASPEEDFNPANYVTKLISLANVSTSLRIQFSCRRPVGTDVDVYVKLLSGDEDPSNIEWIELNDPAYETKFNDAKFIDYVYDLPTANTYSFNKYAVKIRMRSNNQAIVPLVREFRCIALA